METKRSKLLAIIWGTLALVFVITACNPATVLAYISLAEKIALAMVQLAGAPQSQADKIAADLSAANKLIGDLSKAGTNKDSTLEKIDAYLTTAEKDFGDIIMLAAVKDPKVIADVRAGIALGLVAVEGVYNIANQNHSSPPTKVARAVGKSVPLPSGIVPKGGVPTPRQLQQTYNARMVGHPEAQVR